MAKPTYALATVQAHVHALKAAAFTASAINGGQGELGLTLAEMIATIASAKESDCYKTMANNSIDGAFQDVYLEFSGKPHPSGRGWIALNGHCAPSYIKVSCT